MHAASRRVRPCHGQRGGDRTGGLPVQGAKLRQRAAPRFIHGMGKVVMTTHVLVTSAPREGDIMARLSDDQLEERGSSSVISLLRETVASMVLAVDEVVCTVAELYAMCDREGRPSRGSLSQRSGCVVPFAWALLERLVRARHTLLVARRRVNSWRRFRGGRARASGREGGMVEGWGGGWEMIDGWIDGERERESNRGGAVCALARSKPKRAARPLWATRYLTLPLPTRSHE